MILFYGSKVEAWKRFRNLKLGEPDKSKRENGILGIKKVRSWMMEEGRFCTSLKLPAPSLNSSIL